jgi:hypothetical protein
MLQSTNRRAVRFAAPFAVVLCLLFDCHARRGGAPPRARSPEAAPVAPAPSLAHPARLDASAAASAKPDAAADAANDGGNWSKCYEHFRPGQQPKIDVLQLGMMCGPSNGMRQVTPTTKPLKEKTGALYAWFARPGECYRLFVVSPPGSARLTAEIRAPTGARLAELSTRRRWLVVNPDASLCVKRAGRYLATVWAEHATAPPEAQLWRLR